MGEKSTLRDNDHESCACAITDIKCFHRQQKGKLKAMPAITVRNLPDEVHRALRVRAAIHGRSTEAEIREILEQALKPEQRIRMGDALA